MQVRIGDKVTENMPTGLRWPGVAISDQTSEKVTIINRRTGQPVEITVTRADFISLRESREGEKYLALSTEVIQYGYRPVMEPRFNAIVGLDATPDGEIITLQDLVENHGVSYSAWQAANFAARNEVVDAASV